MNEITFNESTFKHCEILADIFHNEPDRIIASDMPYVHSNILDYMNIFDLVLKDVKNMSEKEYVELTGRHGFSVAFENAEGVYIQATDENVKKAGVSLSEIGTEIYKIKDCYSICRAYIEKNRPAFEAVANEM